jgi:hypothetical protein
MFYTPVTASSVAEKISANTNPLDADALIITYGTRKVLSHRKKQEYRGRM